MRRLLTRNTMLWMLVTAYMALLAHAFVPHHHHGEQTAFLNHKSCPHDHHDGQTAQHTDQETTHRHITGDCETLKNVLLSDAQQHVPQLDTQDLAFLTDHQFASAIPDVTCIALRHSSRFRRGPYVDYSYLHPRSHGLRAPPALT